MHLVNHLFTSHHSSCPDTNIPDKVADRDIENRHELPKKKKRVNEMKDVKCAQDKKAIKAVHIPTEIPRISEQAKESEAGPSMLKLDVKDGFE